MLTKMVISTSDDGKVIEVGLPYFLTLPFHYNAAYINAKGVNGEIATIYLMGEDKVIEIITGGFRRRSRLASTILDTFKIDIYDLNSYYITPSNIEYIEELDRKINTLTCKDFDNLFYSISDIRRIFNRKNTFLWPVLAARMVKRTIEYIAAHDELAMERYRTNDVDFEDVAAHQTFDIFGQFIDPFDFSDIESTDFNFGIVNNIHVYQEMVRIAGSTHHFERPRFCRGGYVKGNHASVAIANTIMALAMNIVYSNFINSKEMIRRIISFVIEQPAELISAWRSVNALTIRGFTLAARELLNEWYPKALKANAVRVSRGLKTIIDMNVGGEVWLG